MAKSKLTSDQIKALVESKSIGEISREAGIGENSVRVRLNPVPHRDKARQVYRSLDEIGRHAYIERELKRVNAVQRETQQNALNNNISWSIKEINYLKKHATTKTAAEIAASLKRTFYSVRNFARRNKISLRN